MNAAPAVRAYLSNISGSLGAAELFCAVAHVGQSTMSVVGRDAAAVVGVCRQKACAARIARQTSNDFNLR